MDSDITQHINRNKDQIEDSNTSSQRRRFLESELESLIKYKEKYPNKTEDPSPLDLFCNENPDAPECRIYEV
jgi:hypothetical protein